ncbi:MAG: hypothetical protein WC676_02410 [Candidatus Omnitrophota bacterium]
MKIKGLSLTELLVTVALATAVFGAIAIANHAGIDAALSGSSGAEIVASSRNALTRLSQEISLSNENLIAVVSPCAESECQGEKILYKVPVAGLTPKANSYYDPDGKLKFGALVGNAHRQDAIYEIKVNPQGQLVKNVLRNPANDCGDGECNGTDTVVNCGKDCSSCLQATPFFDGQCSWGETLDNCFDDCNYCGDAVCSSTERCMIDTVEVPPPDVDGDGKGDDLTGDSPGNTSGTTACRNFLLSCIVNLNQCKSNIENKCTSVEGCSYPMPCLEYLEQCYGDPANCGELAKTVPEECKAHLETCKGDPTNCELQVEKCYDGFEQNCPYTMDCLDDLTACYQDADRCKADLEETPPEVPPVDPNSEECEADCGKCLGGEDNPTTPEDEIQADEEEQVPEEQVLMDVWDSLFSQNSGLVFAQETPSIASAGETVIAEKMGSLDFTLNKGSRTVAIDLTSSQPQAGIQRGRTYKLKTKVSLKNPGYNYTTIDACGDYLCGGSEDQNNCPQDCLEPAVCGNGTCDAGETCTDCSGDCGQCQCGDGECNGNEACGCADCSPCCGDETCDANETYVSCPADCDAPPPACNNNGSCEEGETCANCANDCCAPPDPCGDGVCKGAAGEDCTSCPADCGVCPPANCGDKTCDSKTEDCHSCSADCGACPK